MVQHIQKFLGSFNLNGSFFCNMTLNSFISVIVSNSLNLHLFDRISFMNLIELGIWANVGKCPRSYSYDFGIIANVTRTYRVTHKNELKLELM